MGNESGAPDYKLQYSDKESVGLSLSCVTWVLKQDTLSSIAASFGWGVKLLVLCVV